MKKIWFKFKQGLFSKAQFLTGVLIVALVTSTVVYAYKALTLVIFGSGQQISSSDVNSNFDLLNQRLAKSNKKLIVALSADSTIPSLILTDNIFDQVVYDYVGHNYGSFLANSNSFTILEDGAYRILLLPVADNSSIGGSLFVEMDRGGSVNTIANAYIWGSSLSSLNSYDHYLYSGDVIAVKGYFWNDTPLKGSKTKFIFEKLD